MRHNLPVTQIDFPFPEHQRLISATDLKGCISYCNGAFVEVSGFTREELIRSPHNLIRHPDVPPVVFEHLWRTLKQGRPWMGIVKNRRKNGDHYWVSAYVTPILNAQLEIIGYESVRTKPTSDQVRRAEVLYSRLNRKKSAISSKDRWLPVILQWFPLLLISQIAFLVGQYWGNHWGFLLAALLSIPIGAMVLYWQGRGSRRLLRLADQMTADPMIARMYTDAQGVEARLEMAFLSQEAHLKTCLTRLQDSALHVQDQAREADGLAHSSSKRLLEQRQEIDLIAAAMNEMAATTQEVAGNVSTAANAAREAQQLVQQGQKVALGAREIIQKLSNSVQEAGEAVGNLAKDSDKIGSVVDVIKGIADQTNLLALNAAIEAARAGDSGRGFAVVADEVRQLAKRTSDSTHQIHQLIAALQKQAHCAVSIAQQGCQHVSVGVEEASLTDQALTGIGDSINRITDMANQIASATEEQSSVAEDMSRNLTRIAHLSEQNTDSAKNTASLSEGLTNIAQEQYLLVEHFNR